MLYCPFTQEQAQQCRDPISGCVALAAVNQTKASWCQGGADSIAKGTRTHVLDAHVESMLNTNTGKSRC